jgi:phage shock protein C
MTKIYRSRSDKIIFGVCGGLANYLGVDSTIIRLIFIIATIYHGSGILLYIALAIIMPEDSETTVGNTDAKVTTQEKKKEERGRFFGMLLVLAGFYLLIKDFIPIHISSSQLLGVLLLLIGLAIVFRRK